MMWVAVAFGILFILGVIATISAIIETVIDMAKRIYDYFYDLF